MYEPKKDTELIERIEEALRLTKSWNIFDEIEDILTSGQGQYCADVLYDDEKNKIVIESMNRNSLRDRTDPRVLLMSIPGYDYPSQGLDILDLFSDDEIDELEELDNDEDEFFLRHPHPDFWTRCEEAHRFYFVEDGGFDRAAEEAIQRIKGII